MSNTNPEGDLVKDLAPKEPGAPAVDDHDRSGPPAPEVIARGYEADVYDAKTVLSVPLLVILFFVLAFVTVTIIFKFIAYPDPDPRAHPAASRRNNESLNDRMKRIDKGAPVDQPRLEPLKLRAGDARAISQPELPKGNPPEIHPEELRVSKERFPTLYGGDAGKFGLDKTLAMGDDALKELFKVQQAGTRPTDSVHVPTASNAGRGFAESEVVVPQSPKLPEAKKDEKKGGTPEEKKDPKKDGKPQDKKDNKPPTPPDPKGGKK